MMQMAVIETARSLAGIEKAGSTEFGECDEAIVGLMTEWDQDGNVQTRKKGGDLGGTMRLGAYDCKLKKVKVPNNYFPTKVGTKI